MTAAEKAFEEWWYQDRPATYEARLEDEFETAFLAGWKARGEADLQALENELDPDSRVPFGKAEEAIAALDGEKDQHKE